MFRHFNRGHALVGSATVALAVLLPAGLASAAPGKVSGVDSSALPANCKLPFPFRAGNFDRPTRIDNKYLPLVPGTQFVYQGDVATGPGTQPHTIVFTVTDLTKVVDGVTTRVVHDVDLDNGVVQEAELALFAQDDAGNVWNLGEYPEEFENGKFAQAPSVWVSGLQNAQGGLHMLAHPGQHLNQTYLQGRAPRIGFLDCAKVASTGGTVRVPEGRFTGVLTTHETSPLESTTAIQTKRHAPGVGIVQIGAINDPDAETLSLIENQKLGPAKLAQIDAQSRQLDRHGHQVSAVWRQTPPVKDDR
jgi:hypothetical protein